MDTNGKAPIKDDGSALEAMISTLREATDVVVFSGAGLSADSGIPTFRDGATGLWNNVDPDEVASIEGFLRRPQVVWSWLLQLKQRVDECRPNAGHRAIADLEKLCPGKRFTVITQNIDGYHAQAGNREVLEVHGTIHQVRCQRRCGFRSPWDPAAVRPYPCPSCGALVRPDLVLFGEMLDEDVFTAAEVRSLNTDLFFCVGTSFTVQPAAQLPLWAKCGGAMVVEVNPHPTSLSEAADLSIRRGASEFFATLCTHLQGNDAEG